MPELNRLALREALAAALADDPDCLALFEGGSVSFAREDRWSDLDLCLIVTEEAVPAALEKVDAALRALSPVDLRWDVPNQPHEGHAQTFWRLVNAGPYALVDLTVIPRGKPTYYTERELHGEPVVLFDKEELCAPWPLDVDKIAAGREKWLAQVPVKFELFRRFVSKEVARGRSLDAVMAWHTFVLIPLTGVLRIKYDPLRWTWGFRYLHDILPAQDAERLTELAWCSGLDELPEKLEDATAWMEELLAELGR